MKTLRQSEKKLIRRILLGDKVCYDTNTKGEPKIKIRGAFLKRVIQELPLPNIDDKTKEPVTYKIPNTGIQIEGAVIDGILNISHSSGNRNRTFHPLRFENCLFLGDDPKAYGNASKRPNAAFDARNNHFSELRLKRCRIGYIDISNSVFDRELSFDHVTGHTINGLCQIQASAIECHSSLKIGNSTLQLKKADSSDFENIRKDGQGPNYALQLEAAIIHGHLKLRPNLVIKGGINLGSAHIYGDVWADGAEIQANEENAVAIRGQYTRINGILGFTPLFYSKKPDTKSLFRIRGSVRFLNATIGSLSIGGAEIKNTNENDTFTFYLCEINQIEISSREGFGTTTENPISFQGSNIQKTSYIKDVTIKNSDNSYLNLQDIKSNSGLELSGIDCKEIYLEGSSIGSDLNVSNIRCKSIFLGKSSIAGELNLGGSSFDKIYASEIKVERALVLASKIGRQVDFANSVIGGDLYLGDNFKKRNYNPLEIEVRKNYAPKIDFNGADITGSLVLEKKIEFVSIPPWENKVPKRKELELDCYPEWRLFDVIYILQEEGKAYSATILKSGSSENEIIVLDGKSAHIHSLNKKEGALKLDSETEVRNYLKFFCSYVWGEEGAFRIVASEEELAELINQKSSEEIKEDASQENLNDITEVNITAKEDDHWKATAFIFYGGFLFKANFKIFNSGMVEMVNDEPIRDLKELLLVNYNSPFRELEFEEKVDSTENQIIFPESVQLENAVWKAVEKTDEATIETLKKKLTNVKPKIENMGAFQKPEINLEHVHSGGLKDIQRASDESNWGEVILKLNGFIYDVDNVTPNMSDDFRKTSDSNDIIKPLVSKYKFIKILHRLKNNLLQNSKQIKKNWVTFWGDKEDKNRIKIHLNRLHLQFPDRKPQEKLFNLQPFEQVVKVLRRDGRNYAAREILIEKLRLHRKLKIAIWKKPFYWFWDRFLGFGLKKRIVLTTFFVLFFLGWLGVYVANAGKIPFFDVTITNPALVIDAQPVTDFGSYSDKTSVRNAENNEIACGNQIEPALYALDLFIPLIDLKQSSECQISVRKSAWPWRLAFGVYTILGWVVVSTFIFSLSGFSRRETKQ